MTEKQRFLKEKEKMVSTIPGFTPGSTPEMQLTCLKAYLLELNQCYKNKLHTKQAHRQYMFIHQEYKKILEWPKEVLNQIYTKWIQNMKYMLAKYKTQGVLLEKAERLKKELKEKSKRGRIGRKKAKEANDM